MTDWIHELSIKSILVSYAEVKSLYDAGKIDLIEMVKIQNVCIEEIEKRISEK